MKWPYIATKEDTGPFVKALLSVPARKTLIAYRALMSPEDFTKLWGRLNNVTARYRESNFDEVAAIPDFGREGAESYAYIGEFGHEAWEDDTVTHPKDVSFPLLHASLRLSFLLRLESPFYCRLLKIGSRTKIGLIF